jgi:HPt (histidine-containing phosphotransfer) domain-containing protein
MPPAEGGTAMDTASELDKLCGQLGNAEFRASITTTLGEAAEDIDWSQFPDDVRETLQNLSLVEVEALAKVRMTLETAAIADKYKMCLV